MVTESEKQRLKEVFSLIEEELFSIAESIDMAKSDIRKQNRDMWENAPTPLDAYDTGRLVSVKAYMDDLAQRNRALEFKKKRYNILMKMLESAYFGRVDFIEKGSGAPMNIYIGIGTLAGGRNRELMVYDWRAPICSLFYDGETGHVSYMSPEGPVEGEMTLRRQYKIEFDHIIYMIDAAIKIDDEVLMQMLSQKADNKMKTIVTTIQKEQNKIIRDVTNDVMIATGPAGSGKTSVALHRIAFLLYREKELLDHKDILILTPNEIFSDYISTVLPQLGEENVRETTIVDTIRNFLNGYQIQSYMEYMEAMLQKKDNERITNIRIKSSYKYAVCLDEKIESLKQEFYRFRDIIFEGKVVMSGKELSEMYSQDMERYTPLQRMARIKNRVERTVRRIRIKEFEAECKRLIDSEEYVGSMEAKRMAKAAADKKFADIDREISKIESTDITEYYTGFIKESFPEVYDITKSQFEKKYLLYEDIIPFAYFMNEMGSSVKISGIRHVIIDEIQDYPYITVKFLSRLFLQARFTMLGDKNQSLTSGIDAFDPEKHINVFREKKISFVKLLKSYRSSYEIYSFCAQILGDDTYGSTAVERHGEPPTVIRLGSDRYEEIYRIAKNAFDEGHGTVAVITKTIDAAAAIVSKNQEYRQYINFIDNEDALLKKNINVIPSYFAKGLEFDCVIIPDAEDSVYSDEADRRVLYTVCSRALHKLVVCYEDRPSAYIVNKPDI